MPMIRDNLFNLEQYSKGTIYQLCQTLLHDPTAQRDQLRTILAYVNEVIDANWVTPRRLMVRITVCAMRNFKDCTPRDRLATAPTLYHHAPHSSAPVARSQSQNLTPKIS